MNLHERIILLGRLREYMLSQEPEWIEIKEKAYRENQWFIIEFIEEAVKNIATRFLDAPSLQKWADQYQIPDQITPSKTVGIVMAGNIPLVGFHDMLCVFMSGHNALIKSSSKDEVLIKHLVAKLISWAPELTESMVFAERLNGCDAYIATGSNNSSRYFDYYFGKYPNIIRRNRTSVAVLDGSETEEELTLLAKDIQSYFGLGCRNVTQIHVPKDYDFLPLLNALRNYDHLMEYHKYKHNFDYHLALLIMGNKYYMSNESLILTENLSPFSPVSQVHYAFYVDKTILENKINTDTDLQCIVGHGQIPFGQSQSPSLNDYADGVDTMAFLRGLET